MPTQKEIADKAGVSASTVEKVLNDRGGVSKEVKKKVLDVAKQMNYDPQSASVTLEPKGKAFKIGVIIFGGKDKLCEDIRRGMEDEIKKMTQCSIKLIVREIEVTLDAQIKALDEIAKDKIDGLILSPFMDEEIRTRINDFDKKGVPVVTINSDISDTKRLAYVGNDTYRAGRTAGAFLGMITGGHAEVGIITGSDKVSSHANRVKGFLDEVKRNYPDIAVETVRECKDEDYKCYETCQRIAVEHPTLTAFLFTAGGLYGGLKSLYQMTVRSNFTCITFDLISQTKEFMDKGIITAAIGQEPYVEGTKSIEIIMRKLLHDENPESEFFYTNINIKLPQNI